MTPAAPDGVPATGSTYNSSGPGVGSLMETAIEQKYNIAVAVPGGAGATTTAPVAPSTDVSTVFMVCRAVKGPNDSANSELMYALLDNLKASPIVDPKETQVGERLITDDSKYTFTFAVKVALKNPLKF